MLRERLLPWKVGLYNSELISLWGCSFQMSGLTYDIKLDYTTAMEIYCKDKAVIEDRLWLGFKMRHYCCKG